MKTKSIFSYLFYLFLGLLLFSQPSSGQDIPEPKNIIYLVSDGMGYNHVDATSYYQYGESGTQVYEGPDWVQLGLATYPAVLNIENGDTLYAAGYNPRETSENHKYVKSDATDSGAAATALSTGKKVFSGSIGIGLHGDTLYHISQSAKALGKSAGIIASVQLSHATPAGFTAHNKNRSNYSEIARYMLFDTKLDVIMGAGNPDFDDNSNPAELSGRFVGGLKLWEKLKENNDQTTFEIENNRYNVKDATGDGNPDPWHVIQTREEFIELSQQEEIPSRVLGVPKVHNTLHQSRERKSQSTKPFETPLTESVPTLEELTKASINLLSQNEDGFFMMVEGGAVDWAGHSNESDRMIEEQIDFNKSVEAAVEWVEENSNWDETLIIITSDHETGYLTGPGDPDPTYPPVENRGKGNLPGMEWHSGSHTNQLVPFYAKGPGAEIFEMSAGEYDPIIGPFIQNTQIPQIIFLMWGKN